MSSRASTTRRAPTATTWSTLAARSARSSAESQSIDSPGEMAKPSASGTVLGEALEAGQLVGVVGLAPLVAVLRVVLGGVHVVAHPSLRAPRGHLEAQVPRPRWAVEALDHAHRTAGHGPLPYAPMPTLSEADSKRVLAAHGVAFPSEREVSDAAVGGRGRPRAGPPRGR